MRYERRRKRSRNKILKERWKEQYWNVNIVGKRKKKILWKKALQPSCNKHDAVWRREESRSKDNAERYRSTGAGITRQSSKVHNEVYENLKVPSLLRYLKKWKISEPDYQIPMRKWNRDKQLLEKDEYRQCRMCKDAWEILHSLRKCREANLKCLSL